MNVKSQVMRQCHRMKRALNELSPAPQNKQLNRMTIVI